eukprot:scaffold89036_cov85-Cyclotella_meneghiniana.AAC.1
MEMRMVTYIGHHHCSCQCKIDEQIPEMNYNHSNISVNSLPEVKKGQKPLEPQGVTTGAQMVGMTGTEMEQKKAGTKGAQMASNLAENW